MTSHLSERDGEEVLGGIREVRPEPSSGQAVAMNVGRIKQCADRIERNEAALKWLEEYGAKLLPQDRDGFSLTFTPAFAASCPGSKEAKEAIDAMARFEIGQIIQAAIRNCQNTIILDRDAIQEEVSK